jgi:hypothetical protein
MGFEKIKRPILAPGGLQITGGSTFTGAVSADAGVTEAVQSLTGASTGTTLTRYGYTFITVASATESATAGQYRFRLPTPIAGARKTISVDNATTRLIQVVAATSGATFYGTTFNALQFTTGSTQGRVVELIGQNSTTWAVLSGSTATATLVGVAT